MYKFGVKLTTEKKGGNKDERGRPGWCRALVGMVDGKWIVEPGR